MLQPTDRVVGGWCGLAFGVLLGLQCRHLFWPLSTAQHLGCTVCGADLPEMLTLHCLHTLQL
jgi:hypothetical protein